MSQTFTRYEFSWVKRPKFNREDCRIGNLRLGAVWFDAVREKWCSYFDNAHTTERTHETQIEAKLSVEDQAMAAMNAVAPESE